MWLVWVGVSTARQSRPGENGRASPRTQRFVRCAPASAYTSAQSARVQASLGAAAPGVVTVFRPGRLRIASLARASRHPLARALAAACPEAPTRVGVREVPGRGLHAGDARLGSAAFLDLAEPDAGLTLWFEEGSAEPMAFHFADRLRPDAPVALQRLRALGLSVEVLSGDAPPAVAAVAQQAGIHDWTARATPEAKAARVEALRAAGRRPLMVGDGINDAAALALAHVSACPAGEQTWRRRRPSWCCAEGS